MPPVWLHGDLTREKTEELIKAAGLDDGRFLVRSRTKKDEYVLCVVFKGNPTHHLMQKNENGVMCINKKPYGGHKTAEGLISQLESKTAGWPVMLDKPVSTGAKVKKHHAPAAGGDVWLHGIITREIAEERVTAAGLDSGRFLVRTREKPGEYVLCVVYKGKATHHLIKVEDGVCKINKKSYNDPATVQELVSNLSKKTPGWPIPLDKPVPNPDGAVKKKKKKAASAAKEPASKPVPVPVPEPEPEPAREPEPEPATAEPEVAPEPEATPAPAPEATSQPAATQSAPESVSEGQQPLAAAAQTAAKQAQDDVALKMAELAQLRQQANLPDLRFDGEHPGGSSSTEDSQKLTVELARTIIKMGRRMGDLEQQFTQLTQLMQSISAKAAQRAQ